MADPMSSVEVRTEGQPAEHEQARRTSRAPLAFRAAPPPQAARASTLLTLFLRSLLCPSSATPTVVLVHGAFADASSFARVIPELIARGLNVVAPAVPNRSLLGDAEYIASVVRQVPGPVVLVGHPDGGAVISHAASGNPRVKALVYIAAFVPEVGQQISRQHLGAGHHHPVPSAAGRRSRRGTAHQAGRPSSANR